MAFNFNDLKARRSGDDIIGSDLMLGCRKCGGSGYGEYFTNPLTGEPDMHACTDCGGTGDKVKYQEYLEEKMMRE